MNIEPAFLQLYDTMRDIRRDLHAHPELGYKEFRTSDVIANLLTEWGIEVIRGLGVTGVVGVVHGTSDGPGIGLRADMDALPMQETNTFEHASRHEGRMHACGHDGHTAMLLGAAHYLANHRNFAGTVYLIFQPAEEGGAGAKRMIEDGLLERCPMQAVFGMHNWPGMPEGTFGIKAGPIMASSNEFHIRITGRGAHAAMPNLGTDTIVAATQISTAIQSIVSRNVDPQRSAVVSLTQIHAGSAMNVLPGDATLAGTVRTFDTETLDLIETRLRDIVVNCAQALGCEATLEFVRNYPATINASAATAFCLSVIESMVGPDNIDTQIVPSMGAEDFSFMLEEVPGCYVWLGNGDGSHRDAGHGLGPCTLHNGAYDFNDALLPIGATYWIRLVQHWFDQQGIRQKNA